MNPAGDAGQSGGNPGEVQGGGNPGEGGAGEGQPQPWNYAEGLAGEGERPEFFLEKFKSVSDQAKAYTDLEKMFGSFTGAPEEYGEVENANKFVASAIQNLGKDLNLNQEGYEKLVTEITTAINGAEELAYKEKLDEAVKSIPNFERRQQQLQADVVKIMTPEQFSALDSAITTPEGFNAVEALVQASKGGLPGSIPTPPEETAEEIRQQIINLPASDVNGRNALVKKLNTLYGDGEGTLV
mgnify:CR=1 FL=1